MAVPLLATHLWRPAVALPVLVVALALAVRAAWLVDVVPGPRWAAGLLVAVAAGSGVWAAATHAEHLVLRRDAGSYALYGQYLATAHGLPVAVDVPALGGPRVLALPGVTVGSPAFYAQGTGAGTYVVPQFLPATPVFLSLGWWADGPLGLLLAPALALAAALLAFGALARRLVGPGWAVLATATLALTAPVLHAGRSTYSEPFALLVGCAAMTVLVAAQQADTSGRPDTRGGPDASGGPASSGRPDAGRRLALVAGLLLGSVSLVRIDALREIALVLPLLALLSWRGSAVVRPFGAGLGAATLFAAATAGLLSRPYLGTIAGSLLPLVAGPLVLGGGSWLALRQARAGRRLPARAVAALPWALSGALVLGMLVLASRPLWLVVRQSAADSGARVVAGLQLAQGLAIDGGRTYAEATVGWVAWWVGVPALLLALAVAGRLAHRLGIVLRTGEPLPAWLVPAVVGVASSALTFYRPGITPDHPWADRRLVPVVLPSVVLLAVAAFTYRRVPVGRWVRIVAAVPLLLLPAAWATAPLATQRTERGELAAVRQACAAFGPRDTAVLVDNRSANEWPQVLRGWCGVPSLVVRPSQGRLDAATVRAVARGIEAAGRRPVLVSADSAAAIRELGVAARQVVALRTSEDQRLLTRRPYGSAPLAVDLWIGPVSSGPS